MKLEVKVYTKSKESRVVLDAKGSVKVYVKSSPTQGEANREVIKLLAKYFRVPQDSVFIKLGKTSNTKLVEILTNE